MLTRLTLLASVHLLLAYAPGALAADEQAVRDSIALGALVFADNCRKCHQIDGYGEEALYPSLHQQDLLADRALLIQTILNGRMGHQQTPAGEPERLMPALNFLSNREIAALIAFISNSWGSEVVIVSEAEVQAAR